MKLIILKQRQQSNWRLHSGLTSLSLCTPPRRRSDKKEIPFRNTPRRTQPRDQPPAERFGYLPSSLRLGLPTHHTKTLTILSFCVFFPLSVRIPSNSEFDASPRRGGGSGNLSWRMTRRIGDVLESNPVPYRLRLQRLETLQTFQSSVLLFFRGSLQVGMHALGNRTRYLSQ